MKTTRRRLLKVTTSSLVLAWLERAHGLSLSLSDKPAPYAALPSYLETLLPSEGPMPGAIAAGVPAAILEKASATPGYDRLLLDGSLWLEREARRTAMVPFNGLSEEQRVHLITRAENSPQGSLPRVFFRRTHKDALEIYYSKPKVWAALGYGGPPQPLGYPDYRNPPQNSGR